MVKAMPRVEDPLKTRWRAHLGGVALPTLALSAGVLLGWAAIWAAVLGGVMPLWLGAIAQTLLGYLAFTPLHEAVHGNIGGSPKRAWLDHAVGWLCGLLIMAPYPAFKALHLRHHSFTNDPEEDPDFWVAGRGPVSVALRCLTIVPHYYTWILGPRSQRSSALREVRRVAPRVLAALWSAAALLALAGLGAEVLALWVLPAMLASGLLAFFFDWAPHAPHARRGRYVDTRVMPSPALTWLMVFQNYHLIHHLYPRVPFYRYGALFREIAGELAAAGAPIGTWPAPRPTDRRGTGTPR